MYKYFLYYTIVYVICIYDIPLNLKYKINFIFQTNLNMVLLYVSWINIAIKISNYYSNE